MARKVILDVDPGIDDAVAICMALFDSRLDVVTVTAVGGNVSPEQATSNVHTIIEQLDPPRWPRIGTASAPDEGLPLDARQVHGADGLGNAGFDAVELHNRHPSEKVIIEEINAAPDEITIVALGPLTNVARAIQRDPSLTSRIGEIIIMGGAVTSPGNVTPVAEFGVYCDPKSARSVLRSPFTKTLVPLDITSQVEMGFDLLDHLPSGSTLAGKFLRRILPYTIRAHHQVLGQESILLHDAVAMVAVTNPELFDSEMMACDVEVRGELTTGATLFDRRIRPQWRPNVELVTSVDVASTRDCILRSLANATQR